MRSTNKKIAFITGASSGFGKAIAEKFAAGGFDLILNARRAEKLIDLQQQLAAQYGTEVLILPFDVQDKKDVFERINGIPAEWKNIDVLVNNAGLALGRDYFDEASLDDWETMMGTNVSGLIYVSKAVLPFLVERKTGHIINIGSTAGKEVYEKGNIYCASKHAVDAISKSMRIDLLRHGIKVTALHPGAAETEFSLVRFKGDTETASKVYDGFKPLAAEDIAEIAWFCVNLPEHVCINDLVVTSKAQANSFYFNKE
ncbi:MAG: SDR family NAD(P)-dependent oxidoreductase [Flavitalea sp.]